MKLAILSLTKGGKILAKEIAQALEGRCIETKPQGLAATISEIWPLYDSFLFIMATGIVVRVIAPHIHDKKSDPCVVVMDEAGDHAISLLSGHLGGANHLAHQVARIAGGRPVITTASDALGLTPLDLWAKHNNLRLSSRSNFTQISSKLVNSGTLTVYVDGCGGELPKDLNLIDSSKKAGLIISHKKFATKIQATVLRPANLVLGIGCNRGTTASQIEQAVREAFQENNFSQRSIHSLASIDLKNDEEGLLHFAKQHRLPLNFFTASQLNSVPGIDRSHAVYAATGAHAVAEPAAMLGAQTENLLVRKLKWKDVTLAVAKKKITLTADYQ